MEDEKIKRKNFSGLSFEIPKIKISHEKVCKIISEKKIQKLYEFNIMRINIYDLSFDEVGILLIYLESIELKKNNYSHATGDNTYVISSDKKENYNIMILPDKKRLYQMIKLPSNVFCFTYDEICRIKECFETGAYGYLIWENFGK